MEISQLVLAPCFLALVMFTASLMASWKRRTERSSWNERDSAPIGRDKSKKRKDIMTAKTIIAQLTVATVLLAGILTAQAQTNTTTVTTRTTTTLVTTNNITTTNIITVTTTNKTSVLTTNNTTITNTTIVSSTNVVSAQPKVVAPNNGWKSSVAVGVTVARGNTDTTQASISGSTMKKWLQNSLVFGADALYGETKPPGTPKEEESAETLHGFSQYDRVFGANFYGYMRIDGFHDGIADIKYRVTLAPGLGYYFITNKVVDLMGEIGPGYIREQVGNDTESFATLRIAEKCHYAISANARMWETVEFLPQVDKFDNYIVNAELGIEAKLTKGNKLSLRSVLQDSYDNVPAAGRLKNDLKLITSIVYNF
jgi:putative salt-induced outer membrane protein YdiY